MFFWPSCFSMKINNGGNFKPLAKIDKTALILNLSFPNVRTDKFLPPILSIAIL